MTPNSFSQETKMKMDMQVLILLCLLQFGSSFFPKKAGSLNKYTV